jgi:tellurite resistance protein
VRYVVQARPLAPVLVNVATEAPGKVAEPRAFLEVLIAQLARTAERANALSEKERAELLREGRATQSLPGRDTALRAEFGVSAWMVDARISGDLTKTLPPGEAYATTDQLRDAARDALRAIAGHSLIPSSSRTTRTGCWAFPTRSAAAGSLSDSSARSCA